MRLYRYTDRAPEISGIFFIPKYRRKLKQTAGIYHIGRKFEVGDYTTGFVGIKAEKYRGYLLIF
ncbi:MAG: hypothetical protein L6Q59_16825 [Ignavibacteriaceae bacterium]|nr:hypothetical protein [Ignavibacteriaceae bacterium]